MAALTPISRKPMSLVVPTVAASGAVAGLFVGTAQGSGFMGVLIGAALLAVIALVVMQNVLPERMFRWIILAGFAIAGAFIGGLPAFLIGALFGWFFGWFAYWMYEGRYRSRVAPYLTPGQVLWHFTFRVICGAIFVLPMLRAMLGLGAAPAPHRGCPPSASRRSACPSRAR
mgnify:CR=1 FL=1